MHGSQSYLVARGPERPDVASNCYPFVRAIWGTLFLLDQEALTCTEYLGTREPQMESEPGFLIVCWSGRRILIMQPDRKAQLSPHPFLSCRDLAKISCKSPVSLLPINKADKML